MRVKCVCSRVRGNINSRYEMGGKGAWFGMDCLIVGKWVGFGC